MEYPKKVEGRKRKEKKDLPCGKDKHTAKGATWESRDVFVVCYSLAHGTDSILSCADGLAHGKPQTA